MSEPLRKRVLTAVVLRGVAHRAAGAAPAATVLVITAIVLLGAWEWSAFLQLPSAALRAAYVGLVGLLLFGAWSFSVTAAGRDIVMLIALAWWLTALLWIVLAPRRVTDWSAAIAGLLALVPAWLALIRLRVVLPDGAQWVLFALVLVWAADIGAYFGGRRFGRVRLAPQVSPGKTWEGVFGGHAAEALVAIAGALLVSPAARHFRAAVPRRWWRFSIVGDLTESLFKRYAGLKDSGTLFPGHGGVMDRIDSITGAAPVLFLGLTCLGVAP